MGVILIPATPEMRDTACLMCLRNEVPQCPLIHSDLESGDFAILVAHDPPALYLTQLLLVPTALAREPWADTDLC